MRFNIDTFVKTIADSIHEIHTSMGIFNQSPVDEQGVNDFDQKRVSLRPLSPRSRLNILSTPGSRAGNCSELAMALQGDLLNRFEDPEINVYRVSCDSVDHSFCLIKLGRIYIEADAWDPRIHVIRNNVKPQDLYSKSERYGYFTIINDVYTNIRDFQQKGGHGRPLSNPDESGYKNLNNLKGGIVSPPQYGVGYNQDQLIKEASIAGSVLKLCL